MRLTRHALRLRGRARSHVAWPLAAFAALGASLAASAPAAAQAAAALSPLARYAPVGTRVRVTAPPLGDGPRAADVVAWRGDTLVVHPADARDPRDVVTVAPGALRALDVSFGRPRRVGRGARYGAAAGLPVGALVGAGRKTPDCNCGISTQGLNTFAGAFTGAAYGAAAGALAGAFWRPERWERVPALAESAHVRLIARPGTVGVTLGGRF